MSVDILKTISILDHSQYMRASREMAAATESIGAGSTGGLDRVSGAMALAGGLMVGLSAKALKAASDFEQLNRSMTTLYGASTGAKLFGDLKQYTLLTPYTLSDWAKYANLLGGAKENAASLIPVLKDLGDSVTAAKGVDPAAMQRAVYAIAEVHQGITTLRQVRMLQLAGVPAAEYIKKNLGLSDQQLGNLGKFHLPGQLVEAAIMKGIEDDPTRHNAQLRFMDTMAGKVSNIRDKWQLLMADAGTPFLQPAKDGLDFIGKQLDNILKGHGKGFGELLFYGGPALLVGSAALKTLTFWNNLKNAKNLAAIAAKFEMGAEQDKVPVMAAENGLLDTAATKWGKLGTTLLAVGRNGLALAGIFTLLSAAKDTYDEFTNPTQTAFEGMFTEYRKSVKDQLLDAVLHPVRTGAGMIAATGEQGFAKYANYGEDIIKKSKWQPGIEAMNRLNPTLNAIIQHWNDPKIASLPQIKDAATRLHTIVENSMAHAGEKDPTTALKSQMDQYNKILADFNKNRLKYLTMSDNPANDQFAYQLDRAETLMNIAKMKVEHSDTTKHKIKGGKGSFFETRDAQAVKDFNMYRAEALGLIDKNIASISKEADAYKKAGKSAEWLKDQKKILGLMQKAQEIKDDKIGKGKSGLDPTIATILSSAGMSEEAILQRAGIGRRFFRSLGSKSSGLPPDPFKQALQQIRNQKQPVHISLELNGKAIQTLAAAVEVPIVQQLVQILEGSGNRPIMAGG